jgi:hypothetical protein
VEEGHSPSRLLKNRTRFWFRFSSVHSGFGYVHGQNEFFSSLLDAILHNLRMKVVMVVDRSAGALLDTTKCLPYESLMSRR